MRQAKCHRYDAQRGENYFRAPEKLASTYEQVPAGLGSMAKGAIAMYIGGGLLTLLIIIILLIILL